MSDRVPSPEGDRGRHRRRAALVATLVGLALAPAPALAWPDHEGGPPGGDVGPGDINRPPSGAPGAPGGPKTPITSESVESSEEGAGSSRLLGGLLGAAGQDPGAGALGGGAFGSAIERAIDAALLMGSGAREGGTSAVPLPVIANSRNEGTTVGGMVPIFMRNEDGEVDRVIAPMLTYNKIFGVEAGAHAIYYEGALCMGAGAIVSNHVARNLYFEALDERIGPDDRFALEAFVKNEVDPSSRFWGLGPTADTETSNTFRETVLRLNFGVNFVPINLQVFARERFRDVHVGTHGVPSLPATGDVFPDAPGFPEATLAAEALEFRWDQRDEAFMPKNGWWIGGVAEVNCGLAGETARFYPRYVFDARGFFTAPFLEMVTLAGRFRFERLTGSDVPFYEQAILGGRNSIRAYGSDRWTDLASMLFQIEARTTFLKLKLFGARLELQVVPFFDYGRVFHNLRSKVFRLWRWSPGCGFRLAVPPNIIGRVDVGYGDEGANVFVGLGLPF